MLDKLRKPQVTQISVTLIALFSIVAAAVLGLSGVEEWYLLVIVAFCMGISLL
jgi:fatty acid desaturase